MEISQLFLLTNHAILPLHTVTDQQRWDAVNARPTKALEPHQGKYDDDSTVSWCLLSDEQALICCSGFFAFLLSQWSTHIHETVRAVWNYIILVKRRKSFFWSRICRGDKTSKLHLLQCNHAVLPDMLLSLRFFCNSLPFSPSASHSPPKISSSSSPSIPQLVMWHLVFLLCNSESTL